MTELAQWFEANIPWLVGIPAGTLFASALEIINLSKKAKQTIETNKQTKETLKCVATENRIAKDMLKQTEIFVKSTGESIKAVENHLAKTDGLVQNTTNVFNSITNTLSTIQAKQEKLEQALLTLVSNNESLVVSGKAEKIVKTIKG